MRKKHIKIELYEYVQSFLTLNMRYKILRKDYFTNKKELLILISEYESLNIDGYIKMDENVIKFIRK